MFSKVLIATDSSPASHAVVGCAGALRQLGARECTLVQCFMIQEHVAFVDSIKEHIEAGLNQQKQMLEMHGLRTTVLALPGLAATEIPRLADERQCSLIVAGARGHSFSNEIFLGGTAAEIIHQAKRAVLILRLVRHEGSGQIVCAGRDRDLLDHVLYPTDFSPFSAHAFPYVREMVACGARRVTLLHVQEDSRLGTHLKDKLEEFNRIYRERLDGLHQQLLEVGAAEVHIEIVSGSAIEAIISRTGDAGASVVVMGSHGRGFVRELFLGSVSHNVARHAQSAVLLISGAQDND